MKWSGIIHYIMIINYFGVYGNAWQAIDKLCKRFDPYEWMEEDVLLQDRD